MRHLRRRRQQWGAPAVGTRRVGSEDTGVLKTDPPSGGSTAGPPVPRGRPRPRRAGGRAVGSPARRGRRRPPPASLYGGRWLPIAAGVALDRWLGEPPVRTHPVAAFGTLMVALERRWYRDRRSRGMLHAGAGALIGLATGRAVRSPLVATSVAVAGRGLHDAAAEVQGAVQRGDLDRARALLPALVGRDPTGLDAKEICRAVVESVAENTVDAVIAPVVWAGIAGAPGALAYRAVNTLDAMVGHHDETYERFGWASARLDDGANVVPARLTALLVACVRPGRAGAVRRAVRDQAGAHPSPNAGVAEAAFAAALGVRLGGANRYGSRTETRLPLGDGPPPGPADIGKALRLADDVSRATVVGLVTAAAVAALGARATRGAARRRWWSLGASHAHQVTTNGGGGRPSSGSGPVACAGWAERR